MATALVLLASSVPAMAQGFLEVPDTDSARVRIGPLFVKPTVALTNLGVDTNVFNDAASEHPQSDFTFSLTPQAELYLRMGRTWVIGLVKEDVVWYQDFRDERSINDLYSVSWLAPLTRVAFSVGGSYLDTRERPGFEIDTRAQRADAGLNAALELRMLSKTLVGVRGARKTVAFAEAQFFDDTNLERELNRKETTAGVTVRHELTSLTSLTVDVIRQQDRFEFSPDRDADSTRVDGGVRFNRSALVTGSAQVGFRKFEPLSADLPGYSGLVLSANLSYVALGSTKLGLSASRDVQYSFEEVQPYYLQTGMEASIAQQIYGPVDIQARVGTQRLAYEQRVTGLGGLADRVDRIRSYGAGIGYRTDRDLRIGFNVDNARRESDVNDHQYDGLRYGVSITYGL
jgi:hypothetical protein